MTILEAARSHDLTMDHHARVAAGRILHAHYYDAALQRGLTETGDVDGRSTLATAAARAAFHHLGPAAQATAAAEVLEEVFAMAGLGHLDGHGLGPAGGQAVVSDSRYAATRLSMLGEARAPACDVARGLIAGILAALHGRPYDVEETECVAAGGELCRFSVARAGARKLPDWLREGWAPGSDLQAPPVSLEEIPDLARGPEALRALLASDPAGLPGASYGRLWPQVYTESAHAFGVEVPRRMGAKYGNLPAIVLTEAAHQGTFYSLGSLLRSPEWREEVAPALGEREAWVHALIGLLNAFGWGSWRVHALIPRERLTVRVYEGYEARVRVGVAQPDLDKSCYHARGVIAAIMNLVYLDSAEPTASLSSSLYNQLFRTPFSFRAVETSCAAEGAAFCEFVANPMTAGRVLARLLS